MGNIDLDWIDPCSQLYYSVAAQKRCKNYNHRVFLHALSEIRTMPSRISSTSLADLARDSSVTTCSFDYLEKSQLYSQEKRYYFSGPLEKAQEGTRTNLAYTTHVGIPLRDLRGLEDQLKLNVYGFQLLAHHSKINLVDPNDEQPKTYLQDVSSFIKD